LSENVTAIESAEVTIRQIFTIDIIIIIVLGTIAAFGAIITSYRYFYEKAKLSFSIKPITTGENKQVVTKYNIRVTNIGKSPVKNLSIRFFFRPYQFPDSKIDTTKMHKDSFGYMTLDLAERTFLVRENERNMVMPKPTIPILAPKDEYTFPFITIGREVGGYLKFIDGLGRSGTYNLPETQDGKLIVEMLPVGKGVNYKKPLIWELDLRKIKLRLVN